MKNQTLDKITSLRFISLCLVFLLLMGLTMRDPTQPPRILVSSKTESNQVLKLTAIFIYPYDRWAIINNKILRIGDRIGEFTITTITPYTVQLTGSQNSKELLELTPLVKVEK